MAIHDLMYVAVVVRVGGTSCLSPDCVSPDCDGSWFSWFVTAPDRNGSINTRVVHLTAGTTIEMYAYADSGLSCSGAKWISCCLARHRGRAPSLHPGPWPATSLQRAREQWFSSNEGENDARGSILRRR
jgi:hypothetical protein